MYISVGLYVFGGCGRTRTFFFWAALFLGIHRSTGPNWSETQGQTAWVTPPPPTHHDLMKIYRVYRYLHQQKYTLFVDLHVNLFFGHKSMGPNWSETQSQTAWVTPPPHASCSYADLHAKFYFLADADGCT